jgi:hypothetical protein
MNKFKLRILYDEEPIARWIVDEKQKRIIEALAGKDIFYNEVRFEFFEEEERFIDLT